MKKKKDKSIYILLIVVIIAILALLVYTFFNKNNSIKPENNGSTFTPIVKEYKKIWFNSILCSYNCPLSKVTIKNMTGLIPDKVCVESCAEDFRGYKSKLIKNFTREEIASDNLVKDMEIVVNGCKNQSINPIAKTINTTRMFKCSSDALVVLKNNYDYLK